MISSKSEQVLRGMGVSPGQALGNVCKLDKQDRVVFRTSIPKDLIESEIERLRKAVRASRDQLRELKTRLEEKVGKEHSYILDAHALILEDRSLLSQIESIIRGEAANAEWAVRRASDRIREAYDSLDEQYFRERGEDIEDVVERIQRNLFGDEGEVSLQLPEELILVSHDFYPSAFGVLDIQRIKGLVLEAGGPTSHTAIIARSLRIPAIMGIKNLLARVTPGRRVLIDGDRGEVVLDPRDDRVESFRARSQNGAAAVVSPSPKEPAPPRTKDGWGICLQANMEIPHEVSAARTFGAEGIGLFRTEFLFFSHRAGFPTMEEQIEAYSRLREDMSPFPVTIRTLDAVEDAMFPQLLSQPQANPSIGLRGIRLSLRTRDVFESQVEAIVRSNSQGTLDMVLPMVSTIEEVREARGLIQETERRVRSTNLDVPPIRVGAMIEIPAVVLMLEDLADEVDFFCVGSNDLIQYTLAVDRGNPHVSHLFQPLHPSILRSLKRISAVCKENDREVRICGEVSSNPLFAVLLLGMGFRQLSMNPYTIPRIRHIIEQIRMEEAKSIASDVFRLSKTDDIAEFLMDRVSRAVGMDMAAYLREVRNRDEAAPTG